MPTLAPSLRLRNPERPPAPSQLRSGRASLSSRLPAKVPCKKRPSIQLAQRSPTMLLSFFQSSTPLESFRFLRAALSLEKTCLRWTVTAFLPPSPFRVSPVIKVLLSPSETSANLTLDSRKNKPSLSSSAYFAPALNK